MNILSVKREISNYYKGVKKKKSLSPVKGAIVRRHSAALDLSGQVPDDRKSKQSFQPGSLEQERKRE